MLFRIDVSAAEPLFAQLAAQVRSAVARGELDAGERLPAARDVAAALEVNLHTVLHAYQDLRDEGLIELRRGRGAVVTQRAAQDYAPLHEAIDAVVARSRRLALAPETTTALVRAALQAPALQDLALHEQAPQRPAVQRPAVQEQAPRRPAPGTQAPRKPEAPKEDRER